MKRLAWMAALLVVAAAPVRAQQPSIQMTAASQFTTGDDLRLGGQHRIEPDLGIQLFDPGFRFGNLYADISITRRDDHVVVGRGVVRLDGMRGAGLTWSLEGGDTWGAPAVQSFGFANLFSPPVTFQGVSVLGASKTTTFLATAGRITAQRNIFGTDTAAIGQELFQVSFSHRTSDRLEAYARGVYVHSGQMDIYTALTDRSTDAGGGIRYRPTPNLQLVTDGGLTVFQRRGSPTTEYAPAALVGGLWSLSRGWVQLNAQRYPIGYYPVSNYPYSDRSGVFLAAEGDLLNAARVFGGAEYAKSNLNPAASASATVGVPDGTYTRGYGGIRFRLAEEATITVRVEAGGRETRPSSVSPGFESDTGVITTEWHGRFSIGNAFARYERRSNVDPNATGSSFTQHDAAGQMYFSLTKGRQIFATALLSRRADRSGDGQTIWQVGAGAQLPMGPMYMRLEATMGRTNDWEMQTVTARQSLAAGLSGRIAERTYLSVDCYIDHSPFALGIVGSPWVTRTMVRLTRSMPFGTAYSPGTSSAAGAPPRGGPSGRINGLVFVDWNGNGVMDPGEQTVGDIAVTLGTYGSVTTGNDGRFTFSNVPVGEQAVALDLATVPADYDTPEDGRRIVPVARSQTATIQIGLLPLGAVSGIVYQDVDGDGQLSKADTPMDRTVLVLDDGARTEVTREGRFRFDGVRMGTHTVSLLVASLPDGAQLTGTSTTPVELTRDHAPGPLVFLVKLEKRPEIRKVFPPKKGG